MATIISDTCEALSKTLRARDAARIARCIDASDATLEVLAHHLGVLETPADGEKALEQSIDTATRRCEAIAAMLEQ